MTMEQMVASIQQIQSTLSSLSMGVPPIPSGASSVDFDQIVASMTPSVSASMSSLTTPTPTAPAVSTAAASVSSTATGASSSSGSAAGADVVADAKKYIGVPYVLGGESTSGMDCSGLVQKV
jgi:cell wall-associated NlpC family hydrolase